MNIRLYGLRACIKRVKENGAVAQCGKWSIDKKAHDVEFEVCYEDFPIVKCDKGGPRPVGEPGRLNFDRIAKLILEELPYLKLAEPWAKKISGK